MPCGRAKAFLALPRKPDSQGRNIIQLKALYKDQYKTGERTCLSWEGLISGGPL